MKDPLERTKAVLRHLPPAISPSALMDQIDARFAGRYKWASFRPGKTRLGFSISDLFCNSLFFGSLVFIEIFVVFFFPKVLNLRFILMTLCRHCCDNFKFAYLVTRDIIFTRFGLWGWISSVAIVGESVVFFFASLFIQIMGHCGEFLFFVSSLSWIRSVSGSLILGKICEV